MKNLNPSARIFLVLTILWFITLGLAELIYGRLELHLMLNNFHCPFADGFFKYLTHFGSGFGPVILGGLLLFVNVRWALFIGISNSLTGVIIQLLKKSVFSDMMRPTAILDGQLHLPAGVDFHAHHSFPSGHSATAFCLGMGLALIIHDRKWTLPIFLLFSLTAFSRIYLSQHFAGDVAVGSMIGALIALGVWIWSKRFNYPWLDKGIMKK